MKTTKLLLACMLSAAVLLTAGCAGRQQEQKEEEVPPVQSGEEHPESGQMQENEPLYEEPAEETESQPEESGDSDDPVKFVTESVIEFPVMTDDGKLELDSLFQFSGFNPDCGNAEGKEIAGLRIANTASAHLKRAELTLTLRSGKTVRFVVEDIPAGRSAMAFEAGNASMNMDDVCVDIRCDAEFSDEDTLMSDRLAVSAEGTQIHLANLSGEDLNHLIVYCHCVLNEDYFGGLTYKYPIDSLPAGAELTIDAWECYLGQAEVVCIG